MEQATDISAYATIISFPFDHICCIKLSLSLFAFAKNDMSRERLIYIIFCTLHIF